MYCGCKVPVFEVRRENQFDERIAEKVRTLAVIEPEAHFVQICREMPRRDFVGKLLSRKEGPVASGCAEKLPSLADFYDAPVED